MCALVRTSPMRYHDRAPFIPLPHRQRWRWPNGARLAVWVVPNVEYFEESSLTGTTIASVAHSAPDIPNFSWREYGLRVGIWRTMDALTRLDIPATVALNSDVCRYYPQVVDACLERGWELMAHGRTNSEFLPGKSEHEERALIGDVLAAIERYSGRRPTGWLGSALAETASTPDILAEHGVRYVGDWVNDEQPYPLHTAHGEIVAMPYSIEINDIGTFMRRGFTGPDYAQMLLDQFSVLYDEAEHVAKVMCIALHPYITGVPFRALHLEAALGTMRARSDVWFATGSQILEAYRSATSAASAAPTS